MKTFIFAAVIVGATLAAGLLIGGQLQAVIAQLPGFVA